MNLLFSIEFNCPQLIFLLVGSCRALEKHAYVPSRLGDHYHPRLQRLRVLHRREPIADLH